ncbi:MAG: helix-turn-helix domain-containing protein [Pseudomonadota bacterium]
MLLFQSALTFTANATTMVVVLLLIRDARGILAGQLAIPLFLCSIAFSMSILPAPLRLPPGLFQFAIFANAWVMGLGWLFGQALLRDGFRIGPLQLAIFAVISLIALSAEASVFQINLPGQAAMQWAVLVTFSLVTAHLVWIALSGLADDLVDVRRVIRRWFILFVMASFIALVGLQLLNAPAFAQALVYDLTTLSINLAILLWATKLNVNKLFTIEAPADSNLDPDIDPQLQAASARLTQVMEHEKAYLEPDLSLRDLAERTDLREYQLRRLINSTLGHRNFSSFVNKYRVAHAETLLSQSDKASILEIAMDSGYQTLSTFNRAFKLHRNETPSAFRKRRLSERAEQ